MTFRGESLMKERYCWGGNEIVGERVRTSGTECKYCGCSEKNVAGEYLDNKQGQGEKRR